MSEQQQNELVSISDETQVSFKILQDVYNSISGKSESLTEIFKKPYLIELADIDQLNLKIVQVSDQYNVRSSNCNVTIYHTKDTKEVFSSYERFKIYNTSNTSPIENILIEYNFLIILPNMDRPQTYKISIDLPNRIGLWEKASSDNDMPAQIFRVMTAFTGRVKIDYVDYTVARTFQTHINEWFKALNSTKESKFLSMVQTNSHHLRGIAQFGLPALFLAYISTLPYEGIANASTPSEILRYTYLVGSIIVFLFALGFLLGRWIEHSIDRVQPIAYVRLNRGDSKCLEGVTRQNTMGVIKALVGFIATIAVGLLTTILSNLIGLDSLF